MAPDVRVDSTMQDNGPFTILVEIDCAKPDGNTASLADSTCSAADSATGPAFPAQPGV